MSVPVPFPPTPSVPVEIQLPPDTVAVATPLLPLPSEPYPLLTRPPDRLSVAFPSRPRLISVETANVPLVTLAVPELPRLYAT